MDFLETNAEVVITSRAPNSDSQTGLAAKINALNPDFVLSLHANAATQAAEETEMLYFHSSAKSKQMAEIYQKHVLAALKFRDRKILPRKGTDRGGALLQYTKAHVYSPSPFFLAMIEKLNLYSTTSICLPRRTQMQWMKL